MKNWVWWWVVALTLIVYQCRVLTMALMNSEAQAMRELQKDLQVEQSSWPPSEDPCTRWQGVQCVGDHVDSLDLSVLQRVSNQSFNAVLDGLQALPYLRELNASGFTLRFSLPDWITSLQTLQILDLTATSLEGTLPRALGNFSNLTVLCLAGNNITGEIPASVGSMVNLTTLNLSNNKLVGSIPPSIFNASALVSVDLSHNNLTGVLPTTVGNLVNLQFFIASHNDLVGPLPPQLGSLFLLTLLDLSSNNFSGAIPPDLGKLKSLNFLSLATNNLSGTLPSDITQCTGLRTLILRENIVEGMLPATIGDLKELVVLDVSSNRITGLLSSEMGAIKSLEILDIAHNYFYGPIVSELVALRNLKSLNVSHNFFNGSLPSGFLPTAVVKKNCLLGSSGQHELRTCQRFYVRQGVIFGAPTTPPASDGIPMLEQPLASDPGGNKSKTKHLVLILSSCVGGAGLIFLVASVIYCCVRLGCGGKKKGESARTHGSIGSVRGGSARAIAPAVPTSRMGEVFTYEQLQRATKNFFVGNLISNGHSGDIYRGVLESGTMVAIKRIDLTKVKMETYLQELEVLGRASHTRLVLLLGHCLDRDEEKFLVYKYTTNGDLATALHKKGSPDPCEDVLQTLDWITRLKIAIGVAEALFHLHSECSPPIVHRDVKANSILLDDMFEVRLGSLSNARVQDGEPHPSRITRLLGFSQSSDQRDSVAAVSTSSDVYNFGKVLLELVSGKLGISGSTADHHSEAWLEWALPLIRVHDKESLPKLVDPFLIVDEDLLAEVWAMAVIARACLHTKPHKRPSMRHVLKALENPHKVVREEHFGESLAMRTSSHSSWNEAMFGS